MNITDIDDKIIIRSNEKGEDFDTFSRNWEIDFFEDMKTLDIDLPDVITRVSEFVPEIIEFIKQIIEHGYAYESNGSVYFDIDSYQRNGQHIYGKLVPSRDHDHHVVPLIMYSLVDIISSADGRRRCTFTEHKFREEVSK